MRRLLHTFLPAMIVVSGCTFPGAFGDFSFAPDDDAPDGGSEGKDGGNDDEDGGREDPKDGGPDEDGGPSDEDGGPEQDGGPGDMLCMLANCDAVASCDSSSGVPICSCPATGYFDAKGDGTKCADLNECKAGTDECEQDSACKNLPGSYQCDCKLGYIFSRTDDACIDECIVLLSTTCAEEALCLKPQGAGLCRCAFGYMDVSAEKNGSDCEVDTRCVGLTCDPLAICVDAPGGGGACECPAGYAGDGTTCVDIDECADDAKNDCDGNAICSNTGGGFTCACKLGFSGDGKTCVDEDECALDEDNCSRDGSCTNTPGTFTCACNDGYTGDGKTCDDKDECALGTSTCSPSATCTNTKGAFTCACKTGFTGNGTDCQDVDECANGQATCSGAQCTNTPGSYTCGDCPSGYQKNGQGVCVDVDECVNAPCSVNATCANTDGSYACTCKGGYSGDGVRCIDTDECVTNTDNCDANATCTNGAGTFSCACNTGYDGNGVACTDVNECTTGAHDCNATRGTCTNTPGSFTCACKSGYQGDGKSCNDINECTLGTDDCDGSPDACVNTPEGSFSCTCPSGYTGNGKGASGCLRNECTDGSHTCDKIPVATCTDAVDGFTCACPGGSTGTGVGTAGCLRNECTTATHNCDTTPVATCTDTADSFTCTCPAGNTGPGTGASGCLRNECTDGTNTCDKAPAATCTDTTDGFSCACPPGNTGTGVGTSGCLRNECTDGSENCDNSPLAACTDTTDSYSCTCPAGYPQTPSTGGIGQNACCTPDGTNTDTTHPNDGKDNDCDGVTDMPVIAAAAFPEAGGATSGADISISAVASAVTGTHVLQCRTYRRNAAPPSTTTLPFGACTTAQFTAVQSQNKALNGAYRTEVRWAYGNGTISNVRMHDYYVHSSLHGAEKCSLSVSDTELFKAADAKLKASLVGAGHTDPGAFSTSTTFAANPFVTLGFKPLTDGYFVLRGLDVLHDANTEFAVNMNALRHRFVLGGNGRYVLMRRTYASRMDAVFKATNGFNSAHRCKAAQFDYSDQQGGRGNAHIIERCDAVVLNRAGAGVCITVSGTSASIPFSHRWTGANQFGYSDSAKFMYRQLVTERRDPAIGHFTIFSPKCDSSSACETGNVIYLPDRSVLRP